MSKDDLAKAGSDTPADNKSKQDGGDTPDKKAQDGSDKSSTKQDGGDTPDPKEFQSIKHGLKEERQKRQEVEEKLKEYEAEKKKAEEAKLAEEGKYKELLQQKEAEIAELQSFKEQYDKIAEQAEESYSKKLGELPEESRDTVKDVLDGKNSFEKMRLLPEIIDKFGLGNKKDINKQPQDGGVDNGNISKDQLNQQLAEAKKKGDSVQVMGILQKLKSLNKS